MRPLAPRFPVRSAVALVLAAAALVFGPAAVTAAPLAAQEAWMARLLEDPSAQDWRALARFDGTLTRGQFEERLETVYAPAGGLLPYLRFGRNWVAVYPNPWRTGAPCAVITFARSASTAVRPPDSFRTPAEFRRLRAPGRPPLAGLRVAIEPADIGGRWARMEDRSVEFPGYGRICEGDLNLLVGRLLRDRLARLGASVFLIRDAREPVLAPDPSRLIPAAEDLLRRDPRRWSELFENRTARPPPENSAEFRVAAGLFLTKTLETLARADLVRRSFKPDVTIVLQHNATPDSAQGRLARVNRNIFFVHGAYAPDELRDAQQRFRLLTKLLQDTSPVEIQVAGAIAARFRAVTGYPPVLYGNSPNTRLVSPGDPYVVARNLAFNRDHDGPVVVTEPYFMNQPDTLARLLAGDFPGRRRIAGRWRTSIYREYADCVAQGLLAAYAGISPAARSPR